MEILKDLGLPIVVVAILGVAAWLARAVFNLIAEQRSKLAQDVQSKTIAKLDVRIEEFYLPVPERIRLTAGLKHSFDSLRGVDDRYDNSSLQIVSKNPKALRNIAVRRIFLPINRQLADIMLEQQHLRHSSDTTNYQTRFMKMNNSSGSISLHCNNLT